MVAAAAQEEELQPSSGLLGLDLARLIPERTADEILSGEVTLYFGRPAQPYALEVLTIGANRRWKESLEGHLAGLLEQLDSAGDDMASVFAAFSASTDQLLDALYAYDQGHALPAREALEEEATDQQVLLATLGVWSVANPFAAVALAALRTMAQVPLASTPPQPLDSSSKRTNGARPSTAGARRRSSAS